MNKKWLWVLALLLIIPAVTLSGCGCGGVQLANVPSALKVSLEGGQQTGIWVSGEGEAAAVPDIVEARLGIEAQAKTVEWAQADAAEAMGSVMAALDENGVAEKDIQTEYFSIYDVTRWDEDDWEEVTTGYRATNMVTVKIRDVEAAGSIIDAVVAAGGDLVRIDDVSFSVDDPSPYYELAREEAMDDAKAKAQQLADAAGVSLGKPTYVSESSYVSYPPYPRMAMEEAAAPAPAETPISPGEMEIRTSVQVAYAIID